MRHQKKQGFSLVELLIVMVIVGIVFTMMFRVYGLIIDNTRRVNDVVNLSQQVQLIHMSMQTFLLDKRFSYENTVWTGTQGFADRIGFVDGLQKVSTLGYSPCFLTSCVLSLDLDEMEDSIPLFDSNRLVIRDPRFYLIPQMAVSGDVALSETGIAHPQIIHHPGFWMFGTLYPTKYAGSDGNKPSLSLQLFFPLP